MRVPKSAVDGFAKDLDALARRASGYIANRILAVIAGRNPTAADVVSAAREALDEALAGYGDAAAAAGADYFDEFMEALGIDARGMVHDVIDIDEVMSRLWPMAQEYVETRLEENGWGGFAEDAADLGGYLVKRAGRENVARNCEDNGIAYARVPSGAHTCDFCLMLASRGFVYYDAQAAGEGRAFHRGCDCRIVPGTPGTQVEGYDPDALYRRYKDGGRSDSIDGMEELLDRYIHGDYAAITAATQEAVGGLGRYDIREGMKHLLGNGDITADEKADGRALLKLVQSQPLRPADSLTRTEVLYRNDGDKPPAVGEQLNWGIKSASQNPRFAEMIARDEIPGMRGKEPVHKRGSVLAYHVVGDARYYDISEYSDFAGQDEVLLTGKFEVVRVSEREIETEDVVRERHQTPREYAEANGLEIERFTSKKGNAMVRIGDKTFQERQLDSEASGLPSEKEYAKVKVHDVFIKRVR